MIYITKKYCDFTEKYKPHKVWEVDCADVENEYKLFMVSRAYELGLIISMKHLIVANYPDHHAHMFKSEYIAAEKKWNKILKQWNIDRFIADILKGKKLEFKEINRI